MNACMPTWRILLGSLVLLGCSAQREHTAWTRVSTGTNSQEIVSLAGTAAFLSDVCADAGISRSDVKKVEIRPFRDTTLVDIRISAGDDARALKAVSSAIGLLNKKYAVADRAEAVRQMRTDPRNQLSSANATAVAESVASQLPRSRIEVIEEPQLER